MNIIFLDFRPFSHFVHNGFRQRAGRILYHLISSRRVNTFVYVWWNENPFGNVRDRLPDKTEYKRILLLEGRRPRIPFARQLGLDGNWINKSRIREIAVKCRELTGKPYWVWATDPRLTVPARDLANKVNGKLCIDLIDNFAIRFEGKQTELFRKAYEDASQLADKIIANNPEMQNYLNIPDAKYNCVLSGVDWHAFHDRMNVPEPPDIVNLSRPRAGYIGTLSALNDVTFLNAVAERIPECEVVVVGSTAGANKPLHPRIHTLGMKSYVEVPLYVKSFDICLSVYDGRHPSTQYGDSQKIKEYLAAGKPVVASDSLNIRTESPYICVAKNVEEYVRMVREVATKPVSADLREQISLSVANQDWQVRITEMLDFLEESNI